MVRWLKCFGLCWMRSLGVQGECQHHITGRLYIDNQLQFLLGQKYFLNWQKRRQAHQGIRDMLHGLPADWKFKRCSMALAVSSVRLLILTLRKYAGYHFRCWPGRLGPIQHLIRKGILPWGTHSSKIRLTHSRSRQKPHSMMSPTMLMTPGVTSMQQKYILVLNLMALVKRKTMMGTIWMLKNTIKCNHWETALLMDT